MKSMNFSKTILLAGAALISAGAVEAKKPNILFILCDDQDAATLDVYGDTECDTPNIDKLSKMGMTFTQAYQMGSMLGAVSTASRTMMMTGSYLWRVPEMRAKMNKYPKREGNADVVVKGSPEENSMPMAFNRAGYDTYRTCKIGNSFQPANLMFNHVRDAVKRGNTPETGSPWHSNNVIKYLEDRMAMKDNDKKPFYIHLGFSHPHDRRQAREDLAAKYGATNADLTTVVNPKAPKLPVNWLPEKPFHDGHPKLRDEVAVQGVMTRRDEATIRNEKGREFACIENIDIEIGRVLETLKKTGELDNTYIIFTSDHGIAVGKHACMGKQHLYEHCFRVPFIVVGPTVKKNSMAEGNIYLADIMPTFCDLAGIEIPKTAETRSFKPVLDGKKKVIREAVYGAYTAGTKPGIRAVRKGDWKLIKHDVLNGTVRVTELYNLKENPNELSIEHHDPAVIAKTGNTPKKNQVNLASDPKYKKKLAEMEALLLEKMIEHGDPYRLWDQPQL